MKKLGFTIVTVVAILAIGMTVFTQANQPQVNQPPANQPQEKFITTELSVSGMTCGRCINAITVAVSALKGVENVSVDLRAGKVTVKHNPTLVGVAEIKRAIIEDAGYTVN